MSRVYIVQNPMRYDEGKGQMVNKWDFSSANIYGELVYLLSPTAAPFNNKSIILELEEKLAGFTPNDFLLLVGNPCLIGYCHTVATVAMHPQWPGEMPTCLQWSGKDQSYIKVDGGCLSLAMSA